MNIVVTGGTGFIGRRLIARLIARGDRVVCFSRKPGQAADCECRSVDYSLPSLAIDDDAFDGVDVVFHLAGATRAPTADRFQEANTGATIRLVDRILRAGAKPRFVFVSSLAAAGPTPADATPNAAGVPMRVEADADHPIEPYGASKLAAERSIAERELPWTIVRPCAVYGPGDRDFLTIFQMARRGVAVFPGNRDSFISTIFVDDLVDGMLRAAGPDGVGKTFFLSHDEALSFRDIYRTIATGMGRQLRFELSVPAALIHLVAPLGDVAGLVTGRPPLLNRSKAAMATAPFWTCSADRARQELGFVAATSLRDGVARTYSWYVQNQLL